MFALCIIIAKEKTAEELLADNYVHSLVSTCLGIEPIHVDPTRISLELEEINELDESQRMCIFEYTTSDEQQEDIVVGMAYVGPELASVDLTDPKCTEEDWYIDASSSLCTVAELMQMPTPSHCAVTEFFHTTRPGESLRYLVGMQLEKEQCLN